ncbi:hypothetical protein [Aliarcobacter butzleri]|uniref:hypothetical protein n=1 Tax=Aliarcobacter butzleri TaxID=28197 RepID=UPI001269DBA1|nr:hypothetical protein [Aliarcobacter butzleri]
MKALPNNSIEWITNLSIDEALQYKNKFVCYEHNKETGIVKLTFFLNPGQSFSTHEVAANKKLKSLNKEMHFASWEATLLKIDRSANNLHTYIYQADIKIDNRKLNEEIDNFYDELENNETLIHIMKVNTNKPFAVCLALKEIKGKFKELEKFLIYTKNINSQELYETKTIKEIAANYLKQNLAA